MHSCRDTNSRFPQSTSDVFEFLRVVQAVPYIPAGLAGKAAAAKGKAAKRAEGNKTKADLEKEEIAEQTTRRNKMRWEVWQLQFLMSCLWRLCAVNPIGIESAVPLLVPKLVKLFQCPLTFSPTFHLTRILCHQFISTGLLPKSHLVPEALYCSAVEKLPISNDVVQMISSVSTAEPLRYPATSLVQPLINFILQNQLVADPKCYSAALEFLVKQLKFDEPELSASDCVACIASCLRHQPGRVDRASVALDNFCSKLLEGPLVSAVVEIGIADDPAVRFAVVSALQRSRCAIPAANAFLYCCKGEREHPKTAEVAESSREAFGLVLTKETMDEIEGFLSRESTPFRELAAAGYASAAKELCEAEAGDVLNHIIERYVHKTELVSRCGYISALTCMGKIGLIKGESGFKTLFTFIVEIALNDQRKPNQILVSLIQTLGLTVIAFVGGDESHVCDMNAILEDVQHAWIGAEQQRSFVGDRATVDGTLALYFGAIAKFMAPEDTRVKRIAERLLIRMCDPTAPSRETQRSIAEVLPPLIRNCQVSEQIDPKTLVETMLDGALTNESLVSRNGYALGLAAAVKGLGVASMKDSDLIKRLVTAAENKDDAVSRQGAFLCLNALAELLGRLFEPYISSILGTLLNAFSDGAQPVRLAAENAARVIMGRLSAHAVKLVIPNLLTKITDKQWRTKLGSVELLSAMARCAPKQLATFLPQVVPLLCDVVNDSNQKVKEAARESLQIIASVVANAEIRQLSDVLLRALMQPSSENSKAALNALLQTEFTSPVDSPSLALVCPIVVRALRDRGSDTKKKASAIVASMVYLCNEPTDFLPYFPQVVPQLQETLLDPIPDVRSIAAKALGTIAKGLGDQNLGHLLPWLLSKLKSNESSVERSGAANGLSEVLAALGVEKLRELLPSILANAENAAANVSEGYLGLFVFLPTSFGSDFQQFVPEVLPMLLRSLSSDVESLRDVAYRAAEVLVVQYGCSYSALLLPPIEEGVFNPDWRIRHSSVLLLGTLINRLLRANPSFTGDLLESEVLSLEKRAFILSSLYITRSDENSIVRQAATNSWKGVVQNTPKTLKEILPILLKRLMNNLASVSSEKHSVAGRCIGELTCKMPERVLPQIIPACLEGLDHSMAARRRGSCVALSKAIQHAPPGALINYSNQLIPAIQTTLCDEDQTIRETGTDCLRHLLKVLGESSLDSVITGIISSIVDPATFNVEDLDRPPRAAQLPGLEVLLESQTQRLLPIVLSTCSQPPIDLSKLRLMGSISVVRQPAIVVNCIASLFPEMISIGALALKAIENGEVGEIEGISDDVAKFFDPNVVSQELARVVTRIFKKAQSSTSQFAISLLGRMLTDDYSPLGDLSASGQHKMSAKLVELKRVTEESFANASSEERAALFSSPTFIERHADNPYRRAVAVEILTLIVHTLPPDVILPMLPQLFGLVVPRALCDPYVVVQEKGVAAFGAIALIIKRQNLVGQIQTQLRSVVSGLIMDPITGKESKHFTLYGLSRSNALESFYSLYHSGLLVGDAEVKESSAVGLLELISQCPLDALKPVAVKLTGPLIRAAAERIAPSVKALVLNTLRILLEKAGPFLKPLLPQLQISFVKGLSDQSSVVRQSAVSGLGCLADLSATRMEMLLSDLSSSLLSQSDPNIKESILNALGSILVKLTVILDATQANLQGVFESVVYSDSASEAMKSEASKCLGFLLVKGSALPVYLKKSLEPALTSYDSDTRAAAAVVASEIFIHSKIWELEGETAPLRDSLLGLLELLLKDDKPSVRRHGLVMFDYLVKVSKDHPTVEPLVLNFLPQACAAINTFASSATTPVLQIGLKSLKRLARRSLNTKRVQLNVNQKGVIVLAAVNALSLPHPTAKLLAERVIFYALEVPSGNEAAILAALENEKCLEGTRLQYLNEYVRRVFPKMSKALSESESED